MINQFHLQQMEMKDIIKNLVMKDKEKDEKIKKL